MLKVSFHRVRSDIDAFYWLTIEKEILQSIQFRGLAFSKETLLEFDKPFMVYSIAHFEAFLLMLLVPLFLLTSDI